MKPFLTGLLVGFCALAVRVANDYQIGPDSQRHDGVPHGTLKHFEWTNSIVFPGTSRQGWIYVPAQYDPAKPAAVMVFQDGRGYVDEGKNTPGVFPVQPAIARGIRFV